MLEDDAGGMSSRSVWLLICRLTNFMRSNLGQLDLHFSIDVKLKSFKKIRFEYQELPVGYSVLHEDAIFCVNDMRSGVQDTRSLVELVHAEC